MNDERQPRLAEWRVRPTADARFLIEEWRPCDCDRCPSAHHYFGIRSFENQAEADNIVASHNRCLRMAGG